MTPEQRPEQVTESRWHQLLTEPRRAKAIAVAAISGAVFVPVVASTVINSVQLSTTDAPRVQSLQYQVSATPVLVSAAAPETITADKWHSPLAEQPRRARPVPGGISAFYPAPISGSGTGSVPAISIAIPTVQTFQYQVAAAVPVVAELIGADKWFTQFQFPTRRVGLSARNQQVLARVGFAPFAETVSVDRWLEPLSEQPRRSRAVGLDAHGFVAVADATTTDKWFSSFSVPARRTGLGVPHQLSSAYVEAAPFPESVTADRWFGLFSEQPRRPRSASLVAPGFTPTVEAIAPDKWFASFSLPTQRKGLGTPHHQAAAYVGSSPFPETTTPDRWFSDLSKPNRSGGLGVPHQLASAYTGASPFVESVTVDRWWGLFSEQPRLRRLTNLDAATLAPQVSENITSDKWFANLSLPTRVADRSAAQRPQALALVQSSPFAETTTSDRWFANLPLPTRRVGLGVPYQVAAAYVGASPFAETVSVDRWWGLFSEPTRRRRNAGRDLASGLTTSVESITSDKWFSDLSLPTQRIRDAARWQTFALTEASPFAENVSADRWLIPYSEPVCVRYGHGQDAAFVPVVIAASGDNVGAVPSSWTVTPQIFSFQYQVVAESPFTPPSETITLDKWAGQWSSRPSGRFAASSPDAAFVYLVPITGDNVGAVPTNWSVAPKVISFQYQVSAKAPFTPAAAQATTADKWASQWSLHPGGGFCVIDCSSTFIAIENVTEDRWHQPFSEPVRSRPGISVARRQDASAFSPTVFATPGSGVGAVPTNWAATPKVFSFQYQVSSNVPLVAASETIASDKWFRPLLDPSRRIGLPVHQQQTLALTKAFPFAEAVSVDRWQEPYSEPVRIRFGRGIDTCLVQLVASTPSTDPRWLSAFSEPVRSKLCLSSQQQSTLAFVKTAPFAETVSLDRWLQPYAEPVRLRRSSGPDIALVQTVASTPATDPRWLSAFAEPVRSRLGLSAQHQAALELVESAPFTETVSADRWLRAYSEPLRTRRSLGTDTSLVQTVQSVADPRWLSPFAEPARSRLGLSSRQQATLAFVKGSPFAETVSIDRWRQPYSEPVRIRRGRGIDTALVQIVPPTPSLDPRYLSPFAEPLRSRLGLSARQQISLAFVQVVRPIPSYTPLQRRVAVVAENRAESVALESRSVATAADASRAATVVAESRSALVNAEDRSAVTPSEN